MEGLLFSITLGYVLGSLSPGYLLGRLIKHKDIRTVGNKNTGATNTYRNVGPIYGIIAGVFDIGKPALAYWLALVWFGIGADAAIGAGLASVIGHNYPFYLGFRGGKGMAALIGLSTITLFYTQSWYALALVIGAIVYILRISTKVRWQFSGRRLLKLSALVIPLGFLREPELVLAFVWYGLVVVAVFEVVRSFSPSVNRWYLRRKGFAKEKETVRLTGYTLFFISAFVVLTFFPSDIAVFALTLFVVGDTMAPIGGKLGVLFLRKEITHGKNGGGALAIFVFGSLAGVFLSSLAGLDLTLGFIVASALAVVILDLFSFVIDDNLLIPIGSALVMRYLL